MRTSDDIVIQGRIAEAVLTVVCRTPEGAPADRLYAPLKAYMSRARFDAMMRLFVETNRVTKRGRVYFPPGFL